MSQDTFKHTLAASVILYNPAPDVSDNVASYIGSVDHLFVVDNQNGKDVAKRISLLAPERITILTNSENEGIAKPLNTVLHLCQDRYDLLMTMDQDSCFLTGHMDAYRKNFDTLDWSETFGIGPTAVSKEAQHVVDDHPGIHEILRGGTFH